MPKAMACKEVVAACGLVFEIIHKKWIICDMIEYERNRLIVTLIENVIRSA